MIYFKSSIEFYGITLIRLHSVIWQQYDFVTLQQVNWFYNYYCILYLIWICLKEVAIIKISIYLTTTKFWNYRYHNIVFLFRWNDIFCSYRKKMKENLPSFFINVYSYYFQYWFFLFFVFHRRYELRTPHFNSSIRWFRRCKLLNLPVARRVWFLSHLCYFGFIQ